VSAFAQQLVNGVVLGAMYALLALGYTMVYGIAQLINFAHGEIFMLGAFGSLLTYTTLLPAGTPAAAALPAMLAGGMALSVSAAVALERFAYRPLRGGPRLAPLITAIGASIVLQQAVFLFVPDAGAPRPFPALVGGPPVGLGGGVSIGRPDLVVVVAAGAGMAALSAYLRRSRTGQAMQATAQDADAARLVGIDTDRAIVTAFAGLAQGLKVGQVDHRMGFVAGIKAFTAAVLGGIGNVNGAVVGGLLLGVVEVMATAYVGDVPGLARFGGGAWKDVWAFGVLILVLVARPAGLLGASTRVRT
jgi:branched-chain amino acid transport system permease protein